VRGILGLVPKISRSNPSKKTATSKLLAVFFDGLSIENGRDVPVVRFYTVAKTGRLLLRMPLIASA
jgi:hypothetical protein